MNSFSHVRESRSILLLILSLSRVHNSSDGVFFQVSEETIPSTEMNDTLNITLTRNDLLSHLYWGA